MIGAHPFAFMGRSLIEAGASFTFGDIPGIFRWWDASDGSTMFSDTAGTTAATDGNPVRRWNDKIAALALTNSGAGITLDADGLNTHPTLVFNGASVLTVSSSGFGNNQTALSVLAVAQCNVSSTTFNRVFNVNIPSSANVFVGLDFNNVSGSGKTATAMRRVAADGSAPYTVGATSHATTPRLLGARINYSTGVAQVLLGGSVDATGATPSTGSTAASNSGALSLGGYTAAVAPLDGRISEIALVHGYISDETLASAWAASQAKWGLS